MAGLPLDALLRTLDPRELTIPRSVLDNLPPRPFRFGPHQELFRRNTGLVFDAVGPAAAAADATLAAIGSKHGASAAQVALKWLLDQDGVAAIPKAGRKESQQANWDAMKVQLDDEDRATIAALPKDKRFVNPGFAPDWDR